MSQRNCAGVRTEVWNLLKDAFEGYSLRQASGAMQNPAVRAREQAAGIASPSVSDRQLRLGSRFFDNVVKNDPTRVERGLQLI